MTKVYSSDNLPSAVLFLPIQLAIGELELSGKPEMIQLMSGDAVLGRLAKDIRFGDFERRVVRVELREHRQLLFVPMSWEAISVAVAEAMKYKTLLLCRVDARRRCHPRSNQGQNRKDETEGENELEDLLSLGGIQFGNVVLVDIGRELR